MTTKNILIFYYLRFQYPLRKTIEEHLNAFELDSSSRVYYVNTAFRIPQYIFRMHLDLIILHSTLIAQYRWRGVSPEQTRLIKKNIHKIDAVKIALPQDEFFNTKPIETLFKKLSIDHIFSVASPSEWGKIYPRLTAQKTPIHQVLTGYLNSNTVKNWQKFRKKTKKIGYRAWSGEFWAGKHALLKGEIGKKFKEHALKKGIPVDISVDEEDLFLGESWLDFLSSCQYTLGVEGGSSILDADGSIKFQVENYTCKYPKATYEEVERKFFKGAENTLNLKALSPRHLEACMTKTCQILMEGDYNHILEPGKHYIELKQDYSNLEEIFSLLENDSQREDLIQNAYRDIVESRKYTYASFVKYILDTALNDIPIKKKNSFDYWIWFYNHFREQCLSLFVRVESSIFQIIKKTVSKLGSPSFLLNLKIFRNKWAKG